MTDDFRCDGEIVARVLAGETEMFGILVERYEKLVFSYLLPQVRNIQEVEDIAQETFLRAFRFLGSFDVARRMSAWLIRISRNVMIDRQRQNAVSTPTDDLEGFFATIRCPQQSNQEPQARVELKEEFRNLFLSILRLPQDLKVPLMMRVLQELTYEEISELLELPLQTVKNRIFRARQALRTKRDIENEM